MSAEIYRDLIRDLVQTNKVIHIQLDGIIFRDIIYWDTTDDDVLRFICKFNIPAMVTVVPTFGTAQNGNGLQEIILAWDNIHHVALPQIESDLLEKFKSDMPEAYNWWSNCNHVEGAEVKNTQNPITKSKRVLEYEEANATKLAELNRKSGIMTHEEGVIF